MKRWGKWGGWYGRCDAEECNYGIELNDDLFYAGLAAYEGGTHLRVRLIEAAGLRSSVVFAQFTVFRGVVTSKSFGISVASPVRDWGAPTYRPALEVRFLEGATLHYDNPHFRGSRPNRAFFLRKDRVTASFTPEESPEEQASLMDFHFDCITRWSPCASRAELLPKADEEFEAEMDQGRRMEGDGTATNEHNPFTPTCFPTVEIRAREAHDVLVGNVFRASVVPAPWEGDPNATVWKVEMRLLKLLKGKAPGPEGSLISVYDRGDTGRVAVDRPWPFQNVLITGTTAEGWGTHDVVVYSGDCGTVEATPENIAAARQGISRDFGRTY